MGFNIIITPYVFIIFSYNLFKYGVLGIKLQIKKQNLGNMMDVLNSGMKILSHSLKKEITKISICMTNIQPSLYHPVRDNNDINKNIKIVKDDLLFQKAIASFINKQPDMVVVEAVSNKNDAVNLAKPMIIDLILMDINLNGNDSDGIIAAMEILQFSENKIVMLTGIDDASIIMDSFTAGAAHYILKENYIEILNIIRLLHDNETPFKLLVNEFPV